MAKMKEHATRATEKGKAVADRGQAWVDRQDPASRSGVTIAWLKLYKSRDLPIYAMLFTAYFFVTALPAAIVLSSAVSGDASSLSSRLSHRMRLSGETEQLVHNVLIGATNHQLAAVVIAVGNVILFGTGYGRTLQSVHCRAWGIDLGRARLSDQAMYVGVLGAFVGVVLLYLVQANRIGEGWPVLLTVPIWWAVLAAYFIWAPWMLMHKRVPARALVPGAALVALALIGARVASRFFLARWLNWYGQNYGGFGIILAVWFWLFVISSIVVFGAAIAPPLAERRELLDKRAGADSHRPPGMMSSPSEDGKVAG
jgi:membrane protein